MNVSAGAGMLAAMVALSTAAWAAAPVVGTQAPGWYRLMVGPLEVTALSDGTHTFPIDTVMRGLSPDEIAHDLGEEFLTRPVQGSINAFLINTGKKLILVDSGAGSLYGPCCGQVLANLRAAGYQPEQVDEVLITHLHKDHVGGIQAQGRRVFPKAVIRVSKRDLAYWTSSADKAAAPAFLSTFFDAAQAALAPYQAAGRVRPIDAPGEIEDGVEALQTPGHTPGHMSYVFRSGGQTLVVWGDIVHVAALQLPHPAVTVQYDSDAEAARTSRAMLMKTVIEQRDWVAAAHIAFPGLGHLRRAPEGVSWVPVNYDALGAR